MWLRYALLGCLSGVICDSRMADVDCDPSDRPTPNLGLTEEAGDYGCQASMACIEGFCIDRFEASLVEVLDDGTTRPVSPFHNPGALRVRALSLRGAVPQGYISGRQAAAACREAGKRLCDDWEWLRACQGANESSYPYGDTRQDGVCNDARALYPPVELFPDDPMPFVHIQNACINQLPDSLQATGANVGCVTEEGVLDMMGNLHEWTSNPTGTFRGGFYFDTVTNGHGCYYRTTAHNVEHWDYSTGFRCCADPGSGLAATDAWSSESSRPSQVAESPNDQDWPVALTANAAAGCGS